MSLRKLALRLAGPVLAVASTVAIAAKPTSVTFLGDSLSDTGNADALMSLYGLLDLTPSPPYAANVASDGPVWSTYFANAIGRPDDAAPALISPAGRNYAIATARTGTSGASGFPLGMLNQVGLVDSKKQAADATGLYALFGGANDIFDAAGLSNPRDRETAVTQAVFNLSSISQALYQRGARNFLIPNLPDLGKTPAGQASDAATLTHLSERFNEVLTDYLSLLRVQLPGTTFYDLSVDTLYANLLADVAEGAKKFGLTNVTIPCLAGGAPSCGVSVFADDRHPTSAVHKLISDAAYDRVVSGIDVAPVPEPSETVLMLCGLGLVGWMARRAKRAK